MNVLSVAETWRRVWGGGQFFRGSFFTATISDDLLIFVLVIDQVFRIFPFLSQIFRILTMLNVVHVYDPFLTRKTPFFTLLILSRASDNTTSQNIGGTDGWAVPTSNFFGGAVPSPPRSPPLCIIGTGNMQK